LKRVNRAVFDPFRPAAERPDPQEQEFKNMKKRRAGAARV
jgi:hypothetical protein